MLRGVFFFCFFAFVVCIGLEIYIVVFSFLFVPETEMTLVSVVYFKDIME